MRGSPAGCDFLTDPTSNHAAPFDPTSKKTVATVKNITSQKVFKTCKGMCNIVLDMCDPDDATRIKVVGAVQEVS